MITECSYDNVNELINLCNARKLLYLVVHKDSNDTFVMQYDTLQDIKTSKNWSDAKIEKKDEQLRSAYRTMYDLVKQLKLLQSILKQDNNKLCGFSLEFNALKDKPSLTYSNRIPSNFSATIKKEVKIDWDNVFTDRLEDTIPDLFFRRGQKKYIPVKYKDLISIFKSEK